jgi:hypothetical protein
MVIVTMVRRETVKQEVAEGEAENKNKGFEKSSILLICRG